MLALTAKPYFNTVRQGCVEWCLAARHGARSPANSFHKSRRPDWTRPPGPRRDESWLLQRGLTAQHLGNLVTEYNSNRYFSQNRVLDILKNSLDCCSISIALPLASLVDIKPLFAGYVQHKA